MISPLFKLTGEEAKGLLYGLLEVDKAQYAAHPEYPSIREAIRSGQVVYREADPDEHWQSIREIFGQIARSGVAYADCEDLGPALAAEDQVRHRVGSLPYAYSPRRGLFHVVTAVPTEHAARFGGTAFWPPALGAPPVQGYALQDPSAAAGMGVSHLGVRGKDRGRYGALGGLAGRAAGAVASGTKPIFSEFLEGAGLGGGLLRGLGREAGKQVRGVFSSFLGADEEDGSGSGRKTGRSSSSAAPEDDAEEAFAGLGDAVALEMLMESGVDDPDAILEVAGESLGWAAARAQRAGR